MTSTFKPRDWQERCVNEYQRASKENFLLEACVSAGKTPLAMYLYVSLQQLMGWAFAVVVTPSEHLRRQYAQDACSFFGLNLYYSGTDTRSKTLPNPRELLAQNYQGLVVSYQWLTKRDNAQNLSDALAASFGGKVLVILDEVHHASNELSFGQACETAFPDRAVSHRLMTSGTPFRSDKNRILGNWLNYEKIAENTYRCVPDFRYTLADALQKEIIPPFSFVTLEGEFKYSRNGATYEGQTFTNATNEQELRDALNTAIFIDGDWVKEAILWAHNRMKRDRAKGLPECATYLRVPTISAARDISNRIKNLTGEEVLVVVSQDDNDSNSSVKCKSQDDPSRLIEAFAAEAGFRARSWIIGVNMLGEGVSIKRLKYRIHATNICAPLAFNQDLGRLLRPFPSPDNFEPVETLIPAHPTLIQLSLDVLNEVAHVISDPEHSEDNDSDSSEGDSGGDTGNESNDDNSDNISSHSNFIPLASTGEMGAHFVDGEEVPPEYANLAEWLIESDPFFQGWHKTPAHLAYKLMNDSSLFDFFHQKYQNVVNIQSSVDIAENKEVPEKFPSEYATWLSDEKADYARKEVNTKVNRLCFLLYPKVEEEDRKKRLKEIHTIAKKRNNIPLKGFIGHESWEKIYLWLIDRINHAETLKGTEDL